MRNNLSKLLFLSIVTASLHSGFAATTENILVGTTTRNMISYAPSGIAANRPLVISMHGMNQDAAYQQNSAKWEAIADTAKFVVVYPNGLNNAWDISGTSDINFILAIIDTMYNRYKIDTSRVYLSGFSMGGMMTYYAAHKIANKIAAFAPVSGYLLNSTDYTSSRPIPIIHVHGTSDDVVVFSGVQPYLKGWRTTNGCSTDSTIISPYPSSKTSSAATRYTWAKCDANTSVVFISITGKGHWYSMDESSINTSEEIWNFVKNYSLPGSTTPVSSSSSAESSSSVAQTAYSANAIPGTIEAENYDDGGQNNAYYDTDDTTQGKVYRTDGVDVVSATDGYAVGYTVAGEWTEYTVNVAKAGIYSFGATVASGSKSSSFQLFLDGAAITDTVKVDSSSWTDYSTVSGTTTSLTAGTHVLKIAITGSYVNIDRITFTDGTTKITAGPAAKLTAGTYRIFDLQGNYLGSVKLTGIPVENPSHVRNVVKRDGLFILKSASRTFLVNTRK